MVMARRRATRSWIGGWVENSVASPPLVRGLTMNRCAVAGGACIGTRLAAIPIFSRPLDPPPAGVPLVARGPPAEHARPLRHGGHVGDAPRQRGRDGHDERVAVLDVGELMGQDAFQLLLGGPRGGPR